MDLEAYLVHFGWSQAELARRIGVVPETVSRWKGSAPQVVLMYLEELRKNKDYGDCFSTRHEAFISKVDAFLKETGERLKRFVT